MANINWDDLRQIINQHALTKNEILSTTRFYDDYMDFLFTEKERSSNILYIQKELHDGDEYFVLHGDLVDGEEEFATINDAAEWTINRISNVKMVYLPYDGEDINIIINDPNLELSLSDDGETYRMTTFNVNLTFSE